MNEDYFSYNRKRWDERVDVNAKSKFYDLDGFKKGNSSLLPIEIKELPDVKGKSLLHLQCHFGMDTLSWARKGARVTGVDFSEEAIKKARELSGELNIPATFIQANIYDIPKIMDEKFDIVFTSYGVLCWLPDMEKWASIISRMLKPGGLFYIIESHPFGFTIDEENKDVFQAKYPYFTDGKALRYEDDSTYLGDEGPSLKNKVSYEWMHSMAEIINSLIKAGLSVKFLHEFPFMFFPLHPNLKKGEDGYWHFKNPDHFNIPMMFSLLAEKHGN